MIDLCVRWLLVLVTSLAGTLAFANTEMFRGDARHSGVYVSPIVPTLAELKWKFKTGAMVISSPLVADEVVYFGSADHFVYAVRAATGELKWKFETQGPVNASPAKSGGLVVIGSSDGFVYGLDAEKGELRWKFATHGERRFTAPGIHGAIPRTELMADPYDVFLSSPAVADATVYVGSGDHSVYALDLKTGRLRWRFITGNVVHASPAVVAGVVYVGSWDRDLYALDAASGKLVWKFETGDDREIFNQVGIASSAAVVDGIVFFGCRDGHFYALEAKSGKKLWAEDNQKGWVIASPAVKDGVVYFPTSDGERFKALDARTGKTVFNSSIQAISFSSPAIVGDTVFFGTSDGRLHAFDRISGQEKAVFQTDGYKQNAAKYLDEKGAMNYTALYPDSTLDGMIIGVDRMYSMGSVLSSPVVSEGIVYFGSTDGHLYAIH